MTRKDWFYLNFLEEILKRYGIMEEAVGYVASVIIALLIIGVCIIVNLILKKIVLRVLSHYITKNKFQWDNVLLDRGVFQRLVHIAPGIIIYTAAPIFPKLEIIIQRLSMTYILIMALFVVSAVLDSVNDIYKTFSISKVRPIKGLLQVVKIAVYVIMGIVIIANLMGESPLILLSGIGALAAVFSFVFKDSILGFIAGIQLTANDLLRIGDWIEMPKYGADGDVIDITMNTVKVQNFDKTIVSIPAYSLVSDSFKNWRGMADGGGRRIKRSVYIDVNSIGFCTEDMIAKFKKIDCLKEYMEKKEVEIASYNQENEIDTEVLVNGRHLTNIGTFRAYLQNYLKNHPFIHKEMTQMVRQLPPEEHGVPLEIYVFTNDTRWVNYEAIQSDIFDHIFAITEEFGLRLFQNPTGHDMRQISNKFTKNEEI